MKTGPIIHSPTTLEDVPMEKPTILALIAFGMIIGGGLVYALQNPPQVVRVAEAIDRGPGCFILPPPA